MIRILKSFLLIFGFSMTLLLNASCRQVRTTNHNLPDSFSDKVARTVHDIRQFLKKVTVEMEKVSEEGESTSSTPSGKADSDSSKGAQIQTKQVDWIEAPLKEKHLKELGALRIKTDSKGELVKNSISQGGRTFIDPHSQISFINQYYRLDYDLLGMKLPDQVDLKAVKEDPKKLLAFLLGKVDKFYGFPETDYYILPLLEGNYLVLYRLGLPGTIPYDQLPLARQVGDFLATPLVGYLIDYCVPEHKEDDYGHLSDVIVPNCEGVAVESARYVKFQTGGKKLFQYKEKWDLFPADFFNGEWFYLRTVIETSEKEADNIGHQPFDPAHLVEFRKDNEQLVVEDTSAYNLREGDKAISLFIPVKWKEYEKDRDTGGFNSFGEREKPQGAQDIKKPYFSLDFNRLASIEKGNYSGQFSVQRVLITDDSFHFNIHINKKNGTPLVVKYSFKRLVDNPDYPEKRWYEEDSVRFHVFHVSRKYYPQATEVKEKDRDKFYRATRFDPNKGEIVWYFSTQTPKDDWIRDFGRRAVEYENRVFQEAGKYSPRKIKVVLDESEDKELGDLRYNIINLVVTKAELNTGLLGFGPNIANPITGEIVSATANVLVSNIEGSFAEVVRRYIRFHIWPLPWSLLPSSPGVSDFLHEKIQNLCPKVMTEHITKYHGIIPPLHPLHSTGVLDYDKDREIQEQCGRKMARTVILSTTVHEMRHGHGFRHAFSASADEDNYYKSYDEIKAIFGESILMDNVTDSHSMPARFSSLMDYGNFYFPRLTVPGKYDIAATRYLYFDQLETVDEKNVAVGYVTLDSGDESIRQELSAGPVLFTFSEARKKVIEGVIQSADNILQSSSYDPPEKLTAEQNKTRAKAELNSNQTWVEISESQLKKYFVCGGRNFDEIDLGETDPNNPLCRRFDYGSTPREVVQNAIRMIKEGLNIGRRYDSEQSLFPVITSLQQLSSFLIKWNQLRNEEFNNREIDLNNYYISEENAENYKSIIDQILAKKDPKNPFKMFHEAIPPVADFFKEILYLPFKHCVYQKEDGSYKAVAFNVIHNKIKSEYPEHSREVLVNCQSDPVRKWAKKENMGTFIAEVGANVSDRKYFVHPRHEDPFDETIILPERICSPLKCETFYHSAFNIVLKNLILILFEPDVFHDVLKGIKKTVIDGMDINPYIDKVALRRQMGLPTDAPIPEFPSFPNQESYVNAAAGLVPVFGDLTSFQGILNLLMRMRNTSNESIRHLILNYYLFTENSVSLQIKISELTEDQDPLQAKEKMALSYGRSHPFIYQAYEKYLEQYDTEEKRREVPFMEFFKGLPSIYYIDKRKLVIPFDENNMFVNIFKKYNEYRLCVEKADVCEEFEEKLAYMILIENTIDMWLSNQAFQ